MRRRTAILGSMWVGLLSGAVCGFVLGVLLGVRLPVAYFFSILVYSAGGGLAALVLSSIVESRTRTSRVVKISSGMIAGLFCLFGLVYWGNKWLLPGNPFTSGSSIVFDAAALAVSGFVGLIIYWIMGVWLTTVGGHEVNRPLGRMVEVAVLLFVVLPGVLLGLAAQTSKLPHGEAGTKPSVILISIDALRADHLSCYGYERRTSPVADQLAAEGVLFENAFCPVPSTGPSHATMLTGLRPQSHHLRRNGNPLADSLETLAEILSEAGYATAGFTTNVLLDDKFGFTQGFDTYVESGHVERLKPVTWGLLLQTLAAKEIFDRLVWRYAGGEDQTIMCARKWLSRNAGRPFFMFLHLLDPHDPYEPFEPYRSQFPRETEGLNQFLWVKQGRPIEALARFTSLYDGEIAAADAKLGRVLHSLEQAGIMDDVLIVFTADHGENLGDHEPFFRHADIFEGCLRVPLIFRYPRILKAGLAVDGIVENSGIPRTILSLIGVGTPPGLEGENFVPLMRGMSRSEGRVAVANSGRRYALRLDRWKVVIDFKNGSRELYDLIGDPGETANVFSDHEEFGEKVGDEFLAMIKELEGRMPSGEDESSPFEGLDRQTRERLRALGYIQ